MPRVTKKSESESDKKTSSAGEHLSSSAGSINYYAVEVIALLGMSTLIYATLALLLIA